MSMPRWFYLDRSCGRVARLPGPADDAESYALSVSQPYAEPRTYRDTDTGPNSDSKPLTVPLSDLDAYARARAESIASTNARTDSFAHADASRRRSHARAHARDLRRRRRV